jgi:site-specific DNA-adenine methylase
MDTAITIDPRFSKKAPFPWFGGKSKAAPLVWSLLGDVEHYIEPFAGSLAVLLNRPHPCNRPYHSETVNDLDGFIVNVWRALAQHPDAVAEAASWPVTELDKTARQIALLRWRSEVALERLAGDPHWCDPVMAGWWLWAVAVQIGAFSGDGPWTADPATGRIVKMKRSRREPGVRRSLPHLSDNGQGVNHGSLREPGVSRDLPYLSHSGRGVNNPTLREPGVSRDLPHLSDDGQGVNTAAMREPGVSRGLPHLSDDGQGVNNQTLREPGVRRSLPHLVGNGQGVNGPALREPGVCSADDLHPDDISADDFHPVVMPKLRAWFALLQARLRHVRIVNGDWSRVCTVGASHTLSVRNGGTAGFFLDPPYANDVRARGVYAHDDGGVTEAVREWCLKAGSDPKNRIVLAGFDTEHVELEAHGWRVYEWFKKDSLLTGGMGSQQHRERLWASPHCLHPERSVEKQDKLFA